MAVVLFVDDHVNVLRSMAIVLESDGHVVHQASTAPEALAVLRSHDIDVVVTDVRLPGETNGVALLRAIKAHDAEIEVAIITAFGTIDDAVDAIKAGAYDYLTKPVDPERLVFTVRRAAERRALALEVKHLRVQIGGGEIIATSAAMQQVLRRIAHVARTNSTVLITGESGTGKELVARSLHRQSGRRGGKFVPVLCGAIPETLLESELFGHKKGAFTGAVSDKKGLLEEAHGGVLFLDEIGEMPISMQVRLLRFLQSGEVRWIGETETRRVNVRLIAATHRGLEDEVARGRIRQDFYYRIHVVDIHIPALRERPDDIQPLADHFLRRLAARLRHSARGFSPDAIALMKAYSWPGNVRELENAVERALNVASGDPISAADLPAEVTVAAAGAPLAPGETLAGERDHLLAALEQCHWNQSRAAASLGMSRTTLWRKLREYRIGV